MQAKSFVVPQHNILPIFHSTRMCRLLNKRTYCFLPMKSFLICLPCLVSTALTSWTAQLVTSSTGGYTFFPDTVGYQFVVGSLDLSVSALGVRYPSATGLSSTNKVGLWTVGGTLLASVDIPPDTDPSNGYAWKSLVLPVKLNALATYVVGAAGSNFISELRQAGFPTLASDVSLVGAVRNSQPWIFSAPTLIGGTEGQGIVGPNLMYQSVPEPSRHVLVLIGAALLWLIVRRRTVA